MSDDGVRLLYGESSWENRVTRSLDRRLQYPDRWSDPQTEKDFQCRVACSLVNEGNTKYTAHPVITFQRMTMDQRFSHVPRDRVAVAIRNAMRRDADWYCESDCDDEELRYRLVHLKSSGYYDDEKTFPMCDEERFYKTITDVFGWSCAVCRKPHHTAECMGRHDLHHFLIRGDRTRYPLNIYGLSILCSNCLHESERYMTRYSERDRTAEHALIEKFAPTRTEWRRQENEMFGRKGVSDLRRSHEAEDRKIQSQIDDIYRLTFLAWIARKIGTDAKKKKREAIPAGAGT